LAQRLYGFYADIAGLRGGPMMCTVQGLQLVINERKFLSEVAAVIMKKEGGLVTMAFA
jgi:hypothetical protein